MTHRPVLLVAGSALLALAATGCPAPHDRDQPTGVATTSQAMVVTGQTVTEGGFGCGGIDDGTAVTFVSDDGGATFERIPGYEGEILADLVTFDDAFFALRTTSDGYEVVRSDDGRSWSVAYTATGWADDLYAGNGRLVLAHGAGVQTSTDGVTWTDLQIGGEGLYAPHVAQVAGELVVATASGQVQVYNDVDLWRDASVPGLFEIHRLAAAGGRAVAIAHAEPEPGAYGQFLASFDPMDPSSLALAAVDDEVMAVVAAPAGVLVGDGSIARDAAQPGARTAHTDAFVGGSVSGDRVVLVTDTGVLVSRDGGETFQSAELPLVTE